MAPYVTQSAQEQAEEVILAKYAAEVREEAAKFAVIIVQHEVANLFLDNAPGKIIQCIRLLRCAFGLGLKEAKDIVDAVREDRRIRGVDVAETKFW
jgi:ribosomal protein L7/L12